MRLVVALMVELAVGGRGRTKKKHLCRGERRGEQRWLLVVGLAASDGVDGEQVDGRVGWQLKQWRQKGREKCAEIRGRGLIVR